MQKWTKIIAWRGKNWITVKRLMWGFEIGIKIEKINEQDENNACELENGNWVKIHFSKFYLKIQCPCFFIHITHGNWSHQAIAARNIARTVCWTDNWKISIVNVSKWNVATFCFGAFDVSAFSRRQNSIRASNLLNLIGTVTLSRFNNSIYFSAL